jgi:DNA-binding NarL/FixJ family response regulator
MGMITIVLADDHHIVRQGLLRLLEEEPDFKVVGDTGDGEEAIRLCKQLKPDVLVVDIMMPGINGLEVTRQIAKRLPQTKIVVLSMHANTAYVIEALRGGATGYVLKESSGTDLSTAVREAASNNRYLSPPLSEQALEDYLLRSAEAPIEPYETLTDREREVMRLVVQSFSNTEIANVLHISPRTVETHRANLMRKLGLRNPAELIRYAIERGFIK